MARLTRLPRSSKLSSNRRERGVLILLIYYPREPPRSLRIADRLRILHFEDRSDIRRTAAQDIPFQFPLLPWLSPVVSRD